MANISSIGSLFKKTKNDPEFAVTQQRVRQSLLKTLSRAIKEVQLLSTECGEGGHVEDCHATQRLCTRFENALRHGLKSRWFGPGGSFWPLILQISRKQAIEYISGLQYAVSEMGKCRAWIRMAVNECSLESYIGVICQDTSLGSQHYESHAFVRDEDVVGPLQQLLAGLSQINFNITVDTASLEYEAVPEALQPPLQLRLPHHLLADEEVHHKRQRRRKSKSKSHERHVTPIEDSSGEENSDHELGDVEEVLEEADEEEHERGELKEENEIWRPNQPTICDNLQTGREEDGRGEEGHLAESERERKMVELDEGVEEVEEKEDGVMEDIETKEVAEEGGGRGEEAEKKKEGRRDREVFDFGGFLIEDGESQPFDDNSTHQNQDTHIDTHQHSEDNTAQVINIATNSHIQDRQNGIAEVDFDERDTCTSVEEPQHSDKSDISASKSIGMLDGADSMRIVEGAEVGEDEEKEEMMREREEERLSGRGNTALSLEEEFRALECGYSDPNQPPITVPDHPVSSPDHPVVNPGHPVVNPDQFMRPSFQSQTPFNEDSPTTTPDRSSRNPFDLLERDLSSSATGEGHTHSNQGGRERGRNPFDESPSSSLSPSPPHSPPLTGKVPPTTTSTRNNFFQTHLSTTTNATTTTTMNSFDSAQTTPSTTFASPTSSDLISDELPTAIGHREVVDDGEEGTEERDGGERRVGRTDSLEWSMYLEQTMMVDLPEGVASSELNLEEDYYSPELGVPELEEMIQKLKRELISISTAASSSSPSSSSSSLSPVVIQSLRKKIVRLQLKLQTKKEEEENIAPYEEVCGHKLVRQARQRKVLNNTHCLVCKKRVRGLIREWLRCKICQSVCHQKCLSSVSSPCSLPADDVEYILEICPEVGLTDQQFRCVRCNRQLTQTPSVEVRLCDYDGQYYCPDCHVNDHTIIPARVMHNWDFVPRPVCCQCSSVLFHLSSRPLLKVQPINPLLYTHIHDLVEVERLRRDLLVMKAFLSSCRLARDLQLLHRLDIFPNFKENASLLTLQEMVEIQNGSLLPKLSDIHSSFCLHITSHCQTCSSQGQTCSLCHSTEPIFPFGLQISSCPHCSSTFHKDCYREVNSCPACHRPKT